VAAAGVLAGASFAQAGLVIGYTRDTSHEGSGYDIIDFTLTGYNNIGANNASYSVNHNGDTQDSVSGITGTFTPTAGAFLQSASAVSSHTTNNFYDLGTTSAVNFDSLASASTWTGSPTAKTATALNINGAYTSDTNSRLRPNTAVFQTTANGTAINSVAEIDVTTGGGVSFTGSFNSFAGTGVALTFSAPAVGGGTGPLICLVPKSSSVTTTTDTATPLVAGTNATYSPTGQGYIQVLGGHTGGYAPGNVQVSPAVAVSSVETQFGTVSTFQSGDKEVYALAVNVSGGPSGATLTNLITDLGGTYGLATAGNATGASSVTVSGTDPFPAIFGTGGYNVFITASGATTTQDTLLGWDFGSVLAADDPTNFTGATVNVSAVAAVPEPATAAAVIISAAGLLIGRRRRTVA
jgi:hypothetical protein